MFKVRSWWELCLILSLMLVLAGCFGGSDGSGESGDSVDSDYHISGTVVDGETGEGLEGISIKVETESDEDKMVYTNEDGVWEVSGLDGEVELIPVKEGFIFEPESIIVRGEDSSLKFNAFSGENIQIEMQAMNDAPSDPLNDWMDEKTKEFEQETGIEVEFTEISWGEEMQRIPLALEDGEGPNVMQVGTTQNAFFADVGGVLEIDIDEFGGEDNFIPGIWDYTELEGKHYGVPWFAETRIFYYNTEMFAEAGLEGPPETWDELVAVGEQITDEHGEGSAIAVAGTEAWDLIHNWSILLWSYGGEFLNDNNSEAVFNGESGIETLEYYVDLFDKELATDECLEYNQPQVDSDFINGDVAMAFMGPWNVIDIEEENPDLPYSVARPPAGSVGRQAILGGSNLIIRENGASEGEIVASKAWIKFLLRDEQQVDYNQLVAMLPVVESAYEDSYYQEPEWQEFKDTLEHTRTYPSIPVWMDIEQSIVDKYIDILETYSEGDYSKNTVGDNLNEAAKEVDELLN